MKQQRMRDDELKPRMKKPQQVRSRETYERIVLATRDLMDGRDYETISVHEICDRARVSPSSFYARFGNKDALLLHVHEAHRAERMERLARYVTEVSWDDLSSQEIVRACLVLYIQDRRTLEPFLRSLMLAELRFPKIAGERANVDTLGIELIRSRLMKRLGGEDPGLSRRIEFGIRVVCTAAQEAIRPPSQFAHRLGVDDAELATELSHVFCRYVGIGLDHELEAEEPVANAGGGSTRPSARPTFSTV